MKKRWVQSLLLGMLLLVMPGNPTLAQSPTGAVGIYYAGPEDSIAKAINRATPYIVRVDQPNLAQVFVINDAPLSLETLRTYGTQVQRGSAGLVIFCGQRFPQTTSDLSALLGVSTFGMNRTDQPVRLQTGEEEDPLKSAIAWDSTPELAARTVISNPNLLRSIVTTAAPEPTLQRVRGRDTTQVIIVSGWLSNKSNEAWLNWPYFEYFVYRVIVEAANIQRPLGYANYPLSPVPKGRMRLGIAIGGSLLIIMAISSLFVAQRRLYLKPQLIEDLKITSKTTDHVPQGRWDTVGFHRPLAGALAFLPIAGLLAIPLLIYRTQFLPNILIPWPQTLGFWNLTARWLKVAWVLFDIGTSIAIIRHFSAYRPRNPGEAFHYLQFYIWWQFISGAVQIGVIAWISAVIFPNTSLAHLAYYCLMHAIIQFPGFLRVFKLFFRAIQRFDYMQAITLILIAFPLALQSVAVLLLRSLGAGTSGIEETLIGIVGLSAGIYLTEWLAGLVGLLLYKTMGYSLRALLLPAFNRQVVRRTLGFGLWIALGSVAIPLGYLIEVPWLTNKLASFNVTYQNWLVALGLGMVYRGLMIGLYDSLMPAMVEAHSQGYKTLFRYYVSQGLHYSLWFSLFIIASFNALAKPFILSVLGEDYAGATFLILPCLIWGMFSWPAWIAERILEAVGRPAIRSWLILGEQVIRVSLVILLTQRWQMAGLLLAYLIAALMKTCIAWLITLQIAARPRIYLWRSIIAPASAAFVVYRLLSGVIDLQEASSITILGAIVFLFASALFYSFLSAVLGGWDEGGLKEFRRAVSLSSFSYPVAWALYQSLRLGAKISPIHGRTPLPLRTLAEEEAQALTLGRMPIE